MTEQKKDIEELTFREAMSELDSIAALLDGSTLELEDSLKSYERGVTLLANLQKRLNSAEQDVHVLMGKLSGEQADDVRDTTLS